MREFNYLLTGLIIMEKARKASRPLQKAEITGYAEMHTIPVDKQCNMNPFFCQALQHPESGLFILSSPIPSVHSIGET
jgi:hypothetical protein